MQGITRTQVIEGVSSREAFAAIDARNEAEYDEPNPEREGQDRYIAEAEAEALRIGPFSEFEVQARELEVVAQRHRNIALSLDLLAIRLHRLTDAPFSS